MDTISIILIIAAALIGAVVTYFVVKGKQPNMTELQKNSSKVEEAENQVLQLISQKEETEKMLSEANEKTEKLAAQKQHAEKLLSEAKEKIDSLDSQLKAAMSDGKIDPAVMTKFADTEKLKKKIKELEGELEEAEDDLADTEKKLKSKTAELSEVNQKYESLETAYQKTVREVEEIRSELNQKKEELTLKMGSLEFVQSILSAPEVNNSATNALYDKINDVSNFYEDEILGLFDQLFDNKETTIARKESLKKWEATQKKNWIAGKTAIAFVGEFSAGKTSIVNRILSQDNPNIHLLPVSTKATTAIPTYISGGIKTDYHFFTHDNKLKSIKENDFNRVTKEVLDQVNGVSNLIQYFVMTYKNDNLNNLSILDTPGFNSNDKEDSERTLEVINECDALFWVFDVNAGTVNKTSIDLIKQNLKKPLYVVINKVDTKSRSEVDKVEKLIKDTFAREGVNVFGYIRFSAKEPLECIMKPIHQVTRDDSTSNFISFARDEVKDVIKRAQTHTTEKKKEFDAQQRAANNCTDRFNNAISALYNNCEAAAGIPHYNERIFSKDDYRMSLEEYNRLVGLLNTIVSDRTNDIINLYNEQQDHQTQLQFAYGEWQESQFMTKQIQDLSTRWEKLINALNQHSNQ